MEKAHTLPEHCRVFMGSHSSVPRRGGAIARTGVGFDREDFQAFTFKTDEQRPV